MNSSIANIQCSTCKEVFTVDQSDLVFEEVGREERSMGPELYYWGKLEAECPSCGSDIEIESEYSEYPIGLENDIETKASGAAFIRGFHELDVYQGEQVYNFDEEIGLYLPEQRPIITDRLAQSTSELAYEISQKPQRMFEITPRQFEELIAYVFENHGFEVELTKRTRDGGRDIIAIKDELGIPSKYIVECKRYAKGNKVGVDVVRQLFGVQMSEGANKSIVATTSYFTKGAIDFVNNTQQTKWLMSLLDHNEIMKLLSPITSSNG